MKLRWIPLFLLMANLLGGSEATAQAPLPDQPKAEAAAKPTPETETVQPRPFKVEVTLDGVFEAEGMAEVALRPEVWSTLSVEKAAPQGTRVAEGEPILWLDTKKIDEEIRNLEFQQELGRLTLQQTEMEIAALEKSVPLDLEQARRAKQQADEDLAHLVTVGEELSRRSAKESLQSSKDNLEAAEEELDQLEQMYKADDLTEETEEIILKRAKRAVERSRFFLESTRVRVERQLAVEIPRTRVEVEDKAVREAIGLSRANVTLPLSIEQKKIEREKLAFSQQALDRKLADLKADRDMLTAKAPAGGIVYYGQCERGRWTTGATVAKQLRQGGTITANQVVMTIVAPGPAIVRVDIPEKDLRLISPGREAQVIPSAYPHARLAGQVKSVESIPVKEGTFDGTIQFAMAKGDLQIVPGMTCKATFRPYAKEDALTVPESAVFSEPLDESVKFLYVEEAGEPVKRVVTAGETSGGRTEIQSGLKVGEVVLLKRPADAMP